MSSVPEDSDSVASSRLVIAPPHSIGIRATLILSGLSCLVLLLIARWMVPDPQGLGTHRQLGFPECGFLLMFDMPCPSCGMTTSWAWLTRGRMAESLRANPGGTLLGLISFGFGIWMLVSGVRGRWLLGTPTTFWMAILFGAAVLVTLLQWFAQIGF